MATLRVDVETVLEVNKLGEKLAKELGLKRVSQDYVIRWLLKKV